MWNSKEYNAGESWRWWQRIAPHRSRWAGLRRSAARSRSQYPWWKMLAYVFVPHASNGYRPHAVRHPALAVYSVVLIAVKAAVSLGLFLTFPTPAYFSSLTAQRIIALTNEARARIGIASLQANNALNISATLKAEEMAQEGYFAHVSPKGESPWEAFHRAGYVYTYAGENLAMDFSSAEDVVEAWMESPKHRENILNPKYQEIGLAVVTGEVEERTVTLVVQHFGASATLASPQWPTGERTAVLHEGSQPEVAAAATEARLIAVERAWWNIALRSFPWLVGIFALWLIVQLVLTLFVHIRIQHRSVIYACLCVIGIAVMLLYTNVHFLETLGDVPIVF